MKTTVTENPAHRPAFTLVELLVVVAIITLLAAIITPAVYFATVRTKNARTGLEIAAIEKALESYKLEMGEYPPDFSDLSLFPSHSGAFNITESSPSKAERAAQVIRDHLQRTYRRRDPVADLPRDTNGNIDIGFLQSLTPGNALVLWLSGFTNDPVLPLFGDEPRTPMFEFDKGRFGEVTYSAYAVDPMNPPTMVGSQIDLVTGYVPKGKMTPYVYYRAQSIAGATADALCYSNALIWASSIGSPPLPAVSSEFTVPDPDGSGNGICAFVAPKKFQLLSAGQDDDYGAPSQSLAFPLFDSDGNPEYANIRDNNGVLLPNGRFDPDHRPRVPSFPGGASYSQGQEDNITNFSGGTTLEDSKPE